MARSEYIEETADSETFQELVATKYYDDQLEFITVKQLIGAEAAQRLRLLKADLEDEPLISPLPTTSISTTGMRRWSTPQTTIDERLPAAPNGRGRY
ncbi:hypothetical protein C489_20886 [Natrinema versiforme JCM 10478]|uniref:Uncharacterized protein n=1 Tax=Natrinema versiforme JCM 10478 TaxID=1227496 RepID=L9XNA0_9EURY|nr:hypothetical protein [Natrinema versiforme]ELY63007.1 hypothetical protein C489_20886 [Natrinema versiforme JCM 10478]